ncbi:hypothetical protein JOE57_003421 [Microlunatus panaciterrae]|uniref:Uncharacterized protein n=1 Tax=Microlunatus panaciterrae TaxID=400768 RepID=A0ABS2RNC6_9ACTN|nr:hypothetical protein [Microlunatus panaciterrae]MBM7800500.1 hypothetical protein [Microlunatus panaciterrae]
MAHRRHQALRVIAGIVLMAAFVIIAFAVLARYAGGWGVPYFSFQTERGSTCRNTLTGYRCDALTLADLEWYADVDLPDATRINHARYVATHDYVVDAAVEFPKASAAAGLKALQAAYGHCLPDHFTDLDTSGLTHVCVMANDAVTEGGTPSSKLFNVGTGLRKDGVRVASLEIKSR